MLWVGLSGGIGSGKSTVSARLAEHGAVVVDSDRVAREVVEPGMPALAQIADRFGRQVLGPDGSLDRAALGRVVFADEQARRDLEAITHPRIAERTRSLAAAAPEDAVVVHDIPLLVELDRAADYALTLVVDVEADERLRRLVELRGMDREQARARIAAQATDEERAAAADVLLDNGGTVEQLHAAVDRLWEQRLVPFEENLRRGRSSWRAPAEKGATPTDGGPVAVHDACRARARRSLRRIAEAVGNGAVGAAAAVGTAGQVLDVRCDPDGGGRCELVLRVADAAVLDDPSAVGRLRRVGFVVDDGHPRAGDRGTVGPTVLGADPRWQVRGRWCSG